MILKKCFIWLLVVAQALFMISCDEGTRRKNDGLPASKGGAQSNNLDHCDSETIKKTKSVYRPEDIESSSFDFFYRYIKGNGKSETVVIYLPGGPGGTSMEKDNPISEGYDTIYVDPRSVGCNIGKKNIFPVNTLNSDNLSFDVFQIIKSLELKNYIIYGARYGTLWATVLLKKIQDENITLPKSVILSGVLGRKFNGDEVFQEYVNQWEREKKSFSKNVLVNMKSLERPLGLSEDDLGVLVTGLLSVSDGIINIGFRTLEEYLSNLFSDNPEKEINDELKTLTNKLIEIEQYSEEQNKLFHRIACSEISDRVMDMQTDFKFSKGELRLIDKSLRCEIDIALISPFDSSKYQIKVPIFYLQGKNDPATPVWQADYHYKNQNESKKFYALFEGLSHSVLYVLPGCEAGLWDVFSDEKKHNISDFKKALGKCSFPSKVFHN